MTIEQLENKIQETEDWNIGAHPRAVEIEMQRKAVLASLEIALQLAKLHDLLDSRTSE